jgi:hypothetical protein
MGWPSSAGAAVQAAAVRVGGAMHPLLALAPQIGLARREIERTEEARQRPRIEL